MILLLIVLNIPLLSKSLENSFAAGKIECYCTHINQQFSGSLLSLVHISIVTTIFPVTILYVLFVYNVTYFVFKAEFINLY